MAVTRRKTLREKNFYSEDLSLGGSSSEESSLRGEPQGVNYAEMVGSSQEGSCTHRVQRCFAHILTSVDVTKCVQNVYITLVFGLE